MKINALYFLIYEELGNSDYYEKRVTKVDLRNQIEGKFWKRLDDKTINTLWPKIVQDQLRYFSNPNFMKSDFYKFLDAAIKNPKWFINLMPDDSSIWFNQSYKDWFIKQISNNGLDTNKMFLIIRTLTRSTLRKSMSPDKKKEYGLPALNIPAITKDHENYLQSIYRCQKWLTLPTDFKVWNNTGTWLVNNCWFSWYSDISTLTNKLNDKEVQIRVPDFIEVSGITKCKRLDDYLDKDWFEKYILAFVWAWHLPSSYSITKVSYQTPYIIKNSITDFYLYNWKITELPNEEKKIFLVRLLLRVANNKQWLAIKKEFEDKGSTFPDVKNFGESYYDDDFKKQIQWSQARMNEKLWTRFNGSITDEFIQRTLEQMWIEDWLKNKDDVTVNQDDINKLNAKIERDENLDWIILKWLMRNLPQDNRKRDDIKYTIMSQKLVLINENPSLYNNNRDQFYKILKEKVLMLYAIRSQEADYAVDVYKVKFKIDQKKTEYYDKSMQTGILSLFTDGNGSDFMNRIEDRYDALYNSTPDKWLSQFKLYNFSYDIIKEIKDPNKDAVVSGFITWINTDWLGKIRPKLIEELWYSDNETNNLSNIDLFLRAVDAKPATFGKYEIDANRFAFRIKEYANKDDRIKNIYDIIWDPSRWPWERNKRSLVAAMQWWKNEYYEGHPVISQEDLEYAYQKIYFWPMFWLYTNSNGEIWDNIQYAISDHHNGPWACLKAWLQNRINEKLGSKDLVCDGDLTTYNSKHKPEYNPNWKTVKALIKLWFTEWDIISLVTCEPSELKNNPTYISIMNWTLKPYKIPETRWDGGSDKGYSNKAIQEYRKLS